MERKLVQQLGGSFLLWGGVIDSSRPPPAALPPSSSSPRRSSFPCSSSLVAAELPVRLLTYDFLNFPWPHILGLKLFLCSDNKNYFGWVNPAVSDHKVRPTVLMPIVPHVFQNMPLHFSDGFKQFLSHMTSQQNIHIQTKPQKKTEIAAVFVPVLLFSFTTFCLKMEKSNMSLYARFTQTLIDILKWKCYNATTCPFIFTLNYWRGDIFRFIEQCQLFCFSWHKLLFRVSAP